MVSVMVTAVRKSDYKRDGAQQLFLNSSNCAWLTVCLLLTVCGRWFGWLFGWLFVCRRRVFGACGCRHSDCCCVVVRLCKDSGPKFGPPVRRTKQCPFSERFQFYAIYCSLMRWLMKRACDRYINARGTKSWFGHVADFVVVTSFPCVGLFSSTIVRKLMGGSGRSFILNVDWIRKVCE